MDVWFRVAIALFVICAPTLLFLGLWHGLTALRDDDLAGEVTVRQLRGLFDVLPSGQPDAGRFEERGIPDGGFGSVVDGRSHPSHAYSVESRALPSEIEMGVESDPAECTRCGETNPSGAELCWGCGAYLAASDRTT